MAKTKILKKMSAKEQVENYTIFTFERYQNFHSSDIKTRQQFKDMLIEDFIRCYGMQKLLERYKSPNKVYSEICKICKCHVGEKYTSTKLKNELENLANDIEKGCNFCNNSFNGIATFLFMSDAKDNFIWE